ncbi:HmuY family protein [Sphingobacterium sp. UBA6320]|jgi:hypothetical protein|uniref:HmuY family protein n=1 Tax=Sphingobacterium sp. UBA6320 TaxID=1947510 RepID=UPI0025E9AD6B|nr:HmuY family protein [Sphingobacterium sp. UBA6320]
MKLSIKILFYSCIATVFTSCFKPNIEPDILADGKSAIIKDLAGDVNAYVGAGVGGGNPKETRDFYTFLFRFSDQNQTWLKNHTDSVTNFAKTDWDLAFTGQYNGTLFINDGTMENNPAYGNPSRHRIVLIKKPYDQVDSAPEDIEFENSKINAFGIIMDAESSGWYDYNIQRHLVQAMPDRTYVIRLSNGKYVKLQMISVYQGIHNFTPITDLYWPAPYFTFRYFIQEDGTKNLKTSNL